MSLRDTRKQQSRQALLDTALRLSIAHHAFGNVSLREVMRETGMAPAAFYRHFQDMEQLGADLTEQVSLCLHRLRRRLQDSYSIPDLSTRHSVEQFFMQIDQEPENWRFLLQERWGSSAAARQVIQREMTFFARDLARDLASLPKFQRIAADDLIFLTDLVVSVSVSWIMQWLTLGTRPVPPDQPARVELIQQVTRQIQLMFQGVENWHSALEITT